MEQVADASAATLAFTSEAHGFGAVFLVVLVHGKSAQATEVFRPIPLADSAFLLPKYHVQYPVQTIFHPPVAPHAFGHTFGIGARQAADVITPVDGGPIADTLFSLSRHLVAAFHDCHRF